MLSAIGRRFGNGRGEGDARVFRGRTIEELIPRIQRELGPDAIILRRREGLTGGVLGYFQQQWVEIEAVGGAPRLAVYDEQESATAPIAPPAPEPQFEPAPPSDPPPAPPPLAQAPLAPYAAPVPGSQGRARAGVENGLRRYGISERMIGELIDAATAHVLPFAPRSGLAAAVRSTLAQRIPVAPVLPPQGATIVIVGAGGAGKTTCCAALLGAYRQSSTLTAAFATVISEPQEGELQMLLSPQVLKPTAVEDPRVLRALRRARGGGLVVLDTPRVSPAERTGIRRLGRLLAELEPERVLVALPATLGAAAAAQLLESLAPLKPNAMIVTHAEETDQIGVAVEAACRYGLAPEYMVDRGRTHGWRLTRLEPNELAGMVLR
jgi:flagellar biosynthesis GTPase FlhF